MFLFIFQNYHIFFSYLSTTILSIYIIFIFICKTLSFYHLFIFIIYVLLIFIILVINILLVVFIILMVFIILVIFIIIVSKRKGKSPAKSLVRRKQKTNKNINIEIVTLVNPTKHIKSTITISELV